MKLIVNRKTNAILNQEELKDGYLNSESLLKTWINVDGEIELPDHIQVIDLPDHVYDFSKDKDQSGYSCNYSYVDGNIVCIKTIESEYVRQQITWLEDELKSSDYKVIKAYEASLVGARVSYDFNQVHAERQAVRNKINELENLIK